MTDRLHSLQVVLEHDMREDDARGLIEAIKRMRGVADIVPFVADATSVMASIRAKEELIKRLYGVIRGS